MKIKVWTKQPDNFISEACKVLKQRGSDRAQADALRSVQQSDSELLAFSALSEAQFCALEDTAVRLGLQYDGSQEQTQKPECPQGYYWNGRQCLRESAFHLTAYEREGF